MQLSQATLKYFSETGEVAKNRMSMYSVDPNRMVYEITATFSSPYVYFGTKWLSGSKTYVVDAQTGDLLYSAVSGNQVAGPALATIK